MGAVLANYPEIVDSMQWSVDSGFAPCLVIANDNNQVKCGVCYGGRYMVSQIYPGNLQDPDPVYTPCKYKESLLPVFDRVQIQVKTGCTSIQMRRLCLAAF